MRELMLGKVVVNNTTGQSGEQLEKAIAIIEQLTGQRPCNRRAKRTIRTFGIRRGEPISCMVTLRGNRAESFLKRALTAVGNRVPSRSFDKHGNFAFGIREHIDIPGMRYDPRLGIVGMDVMVSVERPGYRVARRKKGRSKIGRSHRVTGEDAVEFIRDRFGTRVGPDDG
jgi:large subunit ribosomal protein L5